MQCVFHASIFCWHLINPNWPHILLWVAKMPPHCERHLQNDEEPTAKPFSWNHTIHSRLRSSSASFDQPSRVKAHYVSDNLWIWTDRVHRSEPSISPSYLLLLIPTHEFLSALMTEMKSFARLSARKQQCSNVTPLRLPRKNKERAPEAITSLCCMISSFMILWWWKL